jgi:hypothetical protein
MKESYLFDPRPRYPFVICVSRYSYHSIHSNHDAEDGATLVFTHGVGQHKEHWEPVIERIYESEQGKGGFAIREAWSVDCPNHGDSAILNEEKLLAGCYDKICKLVLICRRKF